MTFKTPNMCKELQNTLNCDFFYKIFKLISTDKSYSKLNISATLDLKFMKSPLRNPLIFNSTKSASLVS